jgi:hypothetical protein
MRLYLLQRLDGADWDENAGFVIRAKDSKEARKIASEQPGDENYIAKRSPWLQPTLSSCTMLNIASDKPGVILCDFRSGG